MTAFERIQFPRKLAPIFEPHRFKSIRGGRDGGKSWGVARALLQLAARQKELIVCGRETMESIRDSVHRLLENQIELCGLGEHFRIEKTRIWNPHNGSEFLFKGLWNNPDAIKSLESATKLWIEEAQSVSRESWIKAVPTIRTPGSEIWATWNPELETDYTYKYLVLNPPPDTLDIVMNWCDNPWASEVLRPEREKMEAEDPDEYAHIWMGQPRRTMKGAIYEVEMRAADTQGRVTRVPYDRSRPVHTAWDLGWGDQVCIWMFQQFPFETRFIDFESGNQADVATFIQRLQTRGYVWGADYLPWDAASMGRMASGESVESKMRSLGRDVRVIRQTLNHVSIDAVRAFLPGCWFDGEKCSDGLQALRHYRYAEIRELGNQARKPLHDWSSHAAKAIECAALGVKLPKPGDKKPDPNRRTPPPRYSGPYAPFG